MYQIPLNRDVAEISIPVSNASESLSLVVVRQGDDDTYAKMDTFTIKGGTARFRTNTDVHMLPIGLYKAVLMDNCCECCEYPIKITGCNSGVPTVSDYTCDKPVLPARHCEPEPCEEEVCPIEDECDLYRYECGNKVGETVLNFPISATSKPRKR